MEAMSDSLDCVFFDRVVVCVCLNYAVTNSLLYIEP